MVLDRSRRVWMDIKVLRDSETELELEIVGEDHTFCGALRRALSSHKSVIKATYKMEHPLLGSPKIYLKTKKVKVPLKKERVVPLREVAGVGPKREEQLREAGIKSANKMRKADIEKVHKATGIPKKTLEGYVAEAKKLDYGRDTPARYILRESLKELGNTFSDMKAKLKGAS